jgi:hypothetical protein
VSRTTPKQWQWHHLRRRLPILIIGAAALIGALTLRDHLSFDALAQHRETLLALRDAHYLASVVIFILAYAAMVALSLPGATVATLTGGFLFGLFPGVLFNVVAATTGAIGVFLAARLGFGAELAARIEAGGGAAKDGDGQNHGQQNDGGGKGWRIAMLECNFSKIQRVYLSSKN